MSDELEPIETLVKRDLSGWAESLWNCTTGDNYLRGGEYVDLIRTLDSYARKLAAVTAERDALLADAERWRAARAGGKVFLAYRPSVKPHPVVAVYEDEADAIIDAARSAKP